MRSARASKHCAPASPRDVGRTEARRAGAPDLDSARLGGGPARCSQHCRARCCDPRRGWVAEVRTLREHIERQIDRQVRLLTGDNPYCRAPPEDGRQVERRSLREDGRCLQSPQHRARRPVVSNGERVPIPSVLLSSLTASPFDCSLGKSRTSGTRGKEIVRPRTTLHCVVLPPEISMIVPEMNSASSESNQRTADDTSLGTAIRPSGVAAMASCKKVGCLACNSAPRPVLTRPGRTAFTRIPSGPCSLARPIVNASTAALPAA